MNQKELLDLADDIIAGNIPDTEQYEIIANIPEHDAFALLPGADMIRNSHFGREIHLCTICNGKSGKCSEDCKFCSQSVFAETDAPVYPLMEKSELQKSGLYASETPINRYSIVTTGKRLPEKEVAAIAEAMAELDSEKIAKCASLGVLDSGDFEVLKKAGITRYHHNLETAESFFDQICTTHTYYERVDTIKTAKAAGLTICSGGVFGLGESDGQVLEMAMTLRELEVEAVPLNFLVPIRGTAKENSYELTPLRCLKIISMFRYVLPDRDIFVCGGREANLKELHPLIFHAGANGIMTGNYLTTIGRKLEDDLSLLDQLQFSVRG
ncbi:MAG: biotin synthase BioB [Desulfobacteraceae bacterium 4572_88]|nr:MAG: biotin synthase BioB [Desulfobacteraceae bacterium 4572_88]